MESHVHTVCICTSTTEWTQDKVIGIALHMVTLKCWLLMKNGMPIHHMLCCSKDYVIVNQGVVAFIGAVAVSTATTGVKISDCQILALTT